MTRHLRRFFIAGVIAIGIAALGVTLDASFTALCGSGTSCAYQVGDKFGYQTVEKIRQNFNALVAAPYWTSTASSDLTGETNLGALSTGLVVATVSGGTATPSTVAAPTGAVVGTTDTQTLTNKTITCYNALADVQKCVVKITLTDAQIKALPTTAVAIVAAPGAGKRLFVTRGLWRADTTAGAYTNLDATLSKLRLVYSSGTVGASEEIIDDPATPISNLTTFLGTAATTEVGLFYWEDDGPHVASAVENLGINVNMDNNGSGNLTGGNAANSLVIWFEYLIFG